MFPRLSIAKVKGGIFTEPQVRRMLMSDELERKMTTLEKNAWCSFRRVVEEVLSNKKSEQFRELVTELLYHL